MKKQIIAALQEVIDPEIGMDVVALGLIYDVKVSEDLVLIKMTLSTQSCPMHEMMLAWVKNAASSVAEPRIVEVELIWEPAWSVEMIDPAVRAALG